MPKNTENRILANSVGGAINVTQQNQLLAKIGKGQKKGRARDIAAGTEGEFAHQLTLMTVGEQGIFRRGVADYTNASDAINGSCRNGAPNAAALNLDQMFQICTNHGLTNTVRIVYRLMSYKPPALCPYGAPAGGNRIIAGDLIKDDAFFSTSEHRQFLINGIKNPPVGTIYVKFVITGRGGVNVSGGTYTNTAMQQLLEYDNPKTHMFRTADAGQAEILFPRGTILRVDRVVAAAPHWHVVASIPNPQPGAVPTKNSFTGA